MPSSQSKDSKQKKRQASPERRRERRQSSSSRSSSSKKGSPPPRRRQQWRAPNQNIPASTKLFVTNIDSKFSREETEKDIKEFFGVYGDIRDVTIKTKPGSANSYVFIEYASLQAAKKAQSELQGKEFKGKELKVEFGKGERRNQDRRAGVCFVCHQEGHFARDCKYSRDDRSYDRRGGDRHERSRRDDRDRHRRRRSSSSESSYDRNRKKHDRDDHKRRDRDYRRSPDRKGQSYSRRH